MAMNRDTASGKFDQMKGKAKQSIGEAVGNDRLANSGTADQVKGNVKEAWGSTKDAARSAMDDRRTMDQDSDTGNMRRESNAHDVREKITSTARDMKDRVKDRRAS
jgi:uncharacterized protein YjbJ (UPF0337 family)